MGTKHQSYCPYCDQKIEWSDRAERLGERKDVNYHIKKIHIGLRDDDSAM